MGAPPAHDRGKSAALTEEKKESWRTDLLDISIPNGGNMIGRTIGNYEVISPFGEGGMGELYLGRHTLLAREVVIKTIRTEDFTPRQIDHLRERLAREAYIQSQLDHPNIVRVYDFIAVGGTTCIVMEHVPGRDLRKLILRESGPIGRGLRLPRSTRPATAGNSKPSALGPTACGTAGSRPGWRRPRGRRTRWAGRSSGGAVAVSRRRCSAC